MESLRISAYRNLICHVIRTLSVLLGIFAFQANAFGNDYDLEVIVFLNNNQRSTEVSLAGTDRAIEFERRLSRLVERTGAVVAMPASSGNMVDIARKLDASADYTLLEYVTWRQTVESIDDAPFVDISTLNLGDDSGLKGLIRFYHSPLLYVDVLASYTPFVDPLSSKVPATSMQPQGNTPPTIVTTTDVALTENIDRAIAPTWYLEEKRRLKLKEFHYLDNPHFGLIISVWPIENAVE
ncbi:MAG: hypothetical protein DHS20C01_15740 [marine bacterium B5-7]|nr:MAG: hypothetical protein DHS20C01_15740 [marine bacterium B5-7]